jgi:hypothetical protein
MDWPCFVFGIFYLKFKGFSFQHLATVKSVRSHSAQMYRPACLYTGGNDLSFSVPAG